MAVSVTYRFDITTRETLTSTVPDVPSKVVVASGYNESATLNATSTPPATKKAAVLVTLTAGAYTLDLSTMTDASGVAIGTGLRVQLIRIKNLGANAMTFAEGASNGLALACGSIVVPAGGIAQYFLNDASPDMASGDRTLDVTGTGTQTAEVTVVFG
jgi:hypothetical protein